MSIIQPTPRVAANPASLAPFKRRVEPFSIDCRDLVMGATRDGGLPPLPILDHVSLDVHAGEFVAIVGPSGCGKSTILNAIAGFGLPGPLSGGIVIGNEPRKPYQRGLAYMQQQDALLPWKTVRQNVQLAARLSGVDSEGWVDKQIDDVQLEGFDDVFPHQLSGGMRKRAQLAQLLAQRPSALLMDEPFGALDYFTKLEMHRLFLNRWQEEGCTVVFVTHDLNEAISLADRVVVLSKRPTHVLEILDVDIDRPRDQKTLGSSARYQELHDRMWDLLGVAQPQPETGEG